MNLPAMKRQFSRALLATLLVSPGAAFAADSAGGGTTFDLSGGGISASSASPIAGTTVVNDAALDYTVGGVGQTQLLASDPDQGGAASFVVDRLIDVNVTRAGGTKSAAPGGVANLLFDVTNQSNDNLDLFLRAAQIGVDIGTLGTDQVSTASTVGTMCIDLDSSGDCSAGDVDLVPDGGVFLLPRAQLTPGVPVRIVVPVTTSLTAVNGEFDSFVLAAGVGDGSQILTDSNGNSVPGTAPGTDSADDPDVVDDVFGDAAGTDAVILSSGTVTEGAGAVVDGQHSDRDQLQIGAAELTISKVSEVIWDPVSGLKCNLDFATAGGDDYALCDTSTAVATPNAIPGAIVRYTITVSNAAGAATAETVTITDAVPPEVAVGNVEANSGLEASACTGATGLAGTGGTCTGSPESYLDLVIATACDDSVDAQAAANLATGVSLGSCAAEQTGTVVYFVTIP